MKGTPIATPHLPSAGPSAAGFAALIREEQLLSPEDLQSAEDHARAQNVALVDALVSLNLFHEDAAYRLLARACGLELVTLGEVTASDLTLKLVPVKLARRHQIAPLACDPRTLTYATCQPFDGSADADIAFVTGRRTIRCLATRTDVLAALDRLYPKLNELERLAERVKIEQSTVGTMATRNNASAVVELCDHLLTRAVEVGASDIHLEASGDTAHIRYRICGVLEPVLNLSGTASLSVRNRFKVMGNMDIAVRNRPQDGAFHHSAKDRPVDVRVSTLPTVGGEKLVLRVIDSHSPLQSLDRLGYEPDLLARLRKAITRPDGLVLATGPTGSGKTTALYAALAEIRTGRTSIVSVEDPVERTLHGVTQIPVNPRAGNSFATVLRSLLRQDPNVIMVGEIRDQEVAQIVGQAAYTGHLVLSSMHTADAATAIVRLMNLGLEPFKIADSLTGVLAQRLVRCICPQCRRRSIGGTRGPYVVGPGCELCSHTGFVQRAAVAELLSPSPELRQAIASGATAGEIRKAMRAAGFSSMREHAQRLIDAGVTSLDEVNRVLSEDEADTRTAPAATRDVPQSILVADDEPITRMALRLLFEKEQFRVFEAANGSQALDVATHERPSLALVDLNMPEVDGYQVIERIRSMHDLRAMPIIVLTGSAGPEVERRVLEMGADDYVAKPFDASVLVSRVNAAFRRLRLAAA